MANLPVLAQTTTVVAGQHYQFSELEVPASTSDTFDLDMSVQAVAVIHKSGGTAPTISLGTAGGTTAGLTRATFGGSATAGRVVVISRHGAVGIGSSKAGT